LTTLHFPGTRRARELLAGPALGERLDALGDQAVFEDLVIGGHRGVRDAPLLRETAEVADASGLVPV
jgi:hypothetical protein